MSLLLKIFTGLPGLKIMIKHWIGIHTWKYEFRLNQFGNHDAERQCTFCKKRQNLEFYSNRTQEWVDWY